MKNQYIYSVSGKIMIFIMLNLLSFQILASKDDCEADFSYKMITPPSTFLFTNESIDDLDSFFWNFGDGASSIEENPIHTFPGSGQYDVRLVMSTASCTDTIIQTVYVQDPDPCVADFSFAIDTISQRPNIYTFQDLSLGNVNNWEWNFGDGTTSSLMNPTHVFSDTLSYMVSLSISGDSCSDQIVKTVKVAVPLSLDFNFQLDSNNVVPNTFIFHSDVIGYYDHLFWDFDHAIVKKTTDTTHSFSEEDTDYQVCLTAQYNFNDTSFHRVSLCKGLTTSEYFDIGGQVYFGDSLLNNPIPTGDSAIAYLYRIDGDKIVPIDTNYYSYLGYYWFAKRLKAYYIIKTALTANSAHAEKYAPTYLGYTTHWEEADIINLAQDKYREDIHLVEKLDSKSGNTYLSGSVDDILNMNDLGTPATIYLFDMDHQLLDYQYTTKDGLYSFDDMSKGHYWLYADYTGIYNRPKLVFIDGKQALDMKGSNISSRTGIFPNPAGEYCIVAYDNNAKKRTLRFQVFSAQGKLFHREKQTLNPGTNYFRLNLRDCPEGLLILKIMDEQHIITKKFLHY